jgi:LysM repeat protein
VVGLAVGLAGGAWLSLAPPEEEPWAVAAAVAPERALTLESWVDRHGGDGVAAVDPDAPAEWPSTHVVEPGDTLGEIAERYGLAAGPLAEANALGATALLHPGDVLILPNPDRPVPRSARSAVDEAPEVARLLEDTARAFGWRPATVKAVAWAESRWDHGRISPRGAIGVMQVRPGTARVMSRHLGRELDPYDLEDNVVLGVAYLDWLHDRYDGDSRRILTAYVQGPTRLDESGPTPEADRYVARVLRWRELFAAGP